MEVALDVLARRLGASPVDPSEVTDRVSFRSETRYSAAVVTDWNVM